MTEPEAIRSEARRLFDEVIKIMEISPTQTRRFRKLERLLKQPRRSWTASRSSRRSASRPSGMLAHKRTLADAAKSRLDEMENLVVGKPAPAIEGTGMDGRPLKLSDYRGKVVVLVFWGTWCGPCMREVPHEREMAERNKGKPFALLGIDCDSDVAASLKVMKDQGITWPNWNDGDPGEGPITRAYHVRGYPTIIRHRRAGCYQAYQSAWLGSGQGGR